MTEKAGEFFLPFTFLAFFLSVAAPLGAQAVPATLSGAISGPSGAVPYVTVTVKNTATGQSRTARTDAAGHYSVSSLAPGKYEISVTALGFTTKTSEVTLAAGEKQTLDLKLTPSLSLSSLGFSSSETKGSAAEQALLNKRSHMLQIHQKLGLITAIPMIASLVAATQAGGRHSSSTGRNVHMALGTATAGLYFATAYYAMFAPKVPGVEARGPIRFHKALVWIHGPGMILTPILGIMAEQQRNNGERAHGIAKYHGTVAIVTAIAYGLALISVTKPHWFSHAGHDAASIFHLHHHGTESASAGAPAETAKSYPAD